MEFYELLFGGNIIQLLELWVLHCFIHQLKLECSKEFCIHFKVFGVMYYDICFMFVYCASLCFFFIDGQFFERRLKNIISCKMKKINLWA